jgi:hypothetical protein
MANGIQDTQGAGFSTTRVFSRAIGTIRANPIAALGIALLFGVLPSESYAYAYIFAFPYLIKILPLTPYSIFELNLGKELIGLIVAWFSACLVQGAMVRLTGAHDAAQRPSFREGAGAAARVLFPLIALGLLIGLCTTIGLVALAVPGILLNMLWAVSAPVLVEERCGVIAALGRSRRLTLGARGPILGIVVLLWALDRGAGLLRGWLYTHLYIDAMGQIASVPASRLSWAVTGMIAKTCSAAIYTSIYVELRNWKQGIPQAALAEIFA